MSAQVYSVNVVGYVNSTLKPGFNLISNPLNNTATGGNTVGTIFGSALPDGSAVYKFVNGGYEAVNAFSDMFGWDTPGQTLVPGEGVFVFLAGSADVTVTFVGDVNQGALSVPVKAVSTGSSRCLRRAGWLIRWRSPFRTETLSTSTNEVADTLCRIRSVTCLAGTTANRRSKLARPSGC